MNRPLIILTALTLAASSPIAAQPPRLTPPAQARSDLGNLADDRFVELKFGEEIELKALVDYVSRRLEINILYTEQLVDKKVTIKGPGKIPTSSLMGLLQSALRTKDLVIVDAEVSGWKRIEEATKLAQVSRTGNAAAVIKQQGEFGAASAVTQVFILKHVDPTQLDQSIKPFLSLPGANSVAFKDQGVLIVTDFATNLVKIAKLIELLDNPKPEVFTELVPLTHAQAMVLSEQISQLLAARQHATDPVGAAGPSADSVIAVAHDQRTNQLVLIGSPRQIEKIRELVRALDVPLEVTTEVYETKHILAERLDRIVRELVQPAASKRVFASAVDGPANLLFVTTTPEFHERIRALHERMDVPAAKAPSPIAYYRLQHVTAGELLQTLRAIEGDGFDSSAGREPSGRGLINSSNATRGADRSLRGRMSGGNAGSDSSSSRTDPSRQLGVAGVNRPPPAPGTELPLPPAYRSSPDGGGTLAAGMPDDSGPRYLPGQARVTADESSNTLIIVADPEVQQVYADLIRTLDQPRPQVLIEAKLVVIDMSHDLALGVEVSGGDRTGLKKLFAFTSYGLSTVDPITGALSIIPGTGFNGTLVDPEVADAVVRALSTHRHARILSSPRVLVNDNAEGVLSSVAEVPFTSVNASNTVATTSFAGFAEAGTSIVVRPHIGAKDYLQLEFVVSMNSFTGTGADGIPPARQTEEVQSIITIPDGHTVIVGGLNREEARNMTDRIPFVEHIPIVKYLTGIESNNKRSTSLFVFIRPVILRDDKFKALKFLSDCDLKRASVHGRFPCSDPVPILVHKESSRSATPRPAPVTYQNGTPADNAGTPAIRTGPNRTRPPSGTGTLESEIDVGGREPVVPASLVRGKSASAHRSISGN